MSKVNYAETSPYSGTSQTNVYLEYLDFWRGSYIPARDSDSRLEILDRYNQRPDLLSNDLYGTAGYWWVFALRNPDIIKDPIYDLRGGVVIYAPTKDNLPRMMSV